MDILMLLEMAAEADGDRVAVGDRRSGLTYRQLLDRARSLGQEMRAERASYVALLDLNTPAVPVALFGAAAAGLPLAPLNFRLTDEQVATALARLAPVLVLAGADAAPRVTAGPGVTVRSAEKVLEGSPACPDSARAPVASDAPAVLLFTSGTSGEPKAAVLRHRHLSAYIVSTVEFFGADPDEAILVSVPNYHIAGISSVLSSVYSGRRIVQLPLFTAEAWVEAVVTEAVTQAMVVPTMLGRILDVIERSGTSLPTLRALSYGGGRMPIEVVERATRLLPQVDFVNAYGLTETSSTISILGPEEHRAAVGSDDPQVRRRLGSVGRPLPSIEVQVRDPDGRVLTSGESGEIFVRGDQVSGEYLSHHALDDAGWYPTRDRGYLDGAGYLFLDGRADDVIVRGAENISPGEIEDVLGEHPGIASSAVVGVPDIEWGEVPEAVVVPRAGYRVDERDLQEWVRVRLRSTRVPRRVHVRAELPYNETGKLLRRVLRDELAAGSAER